MTNCILYQHTLPQYRYEFIEMLLTERNYTLACADTMAINSFLKRHPELADRVQFCRHRVFSIAGRKFEITWSRALFSCPNVIVIPNRAQDLGLWLVALVRKLAGRPTYYRGHGMGLRFARSHKLRQVINVLQSTLSKGIFTYSRFETHSFTAAASTAGYPGWKKKVPSNNTHIDWRNLPWKDYREHELPTAVFIGSGSKKQRVLELASYLCASKSVRLKLMVPRADYDEMPQEVRQFVSYHAPTYKKEEIDDFFCDVDCGVTFGSVGLFVNECYARGRPVLCLSHELGEEYRHAPEFAFVVAFNQKHVFVSTDQLVSFLTSFKLTKDVFYDIRDFYEKNLNLSQMVTCFPEGNAK